jgi:hypothetical protein
MVQEIHEYSTTFILQIVRSENPRNSASNSPVLRRFLEKNPTAHSFCLFHLLFIVKLNCKVTVNP